MAKDIYKDLYGSAYKSQKTKNAAEKRKKTMSRNDLIKKATYEKQFSSDVKDYASKNNMQYSDRLKTAAELYYKNKSVGEKFLKQSNVDSVRRQNQVVKSNASFMNKDTGGFKEQEYNKMRKQIGLNEDSSVTQKKFDDITATFNRMKNLKGSTSKEVDSSFSKKLDKTLDKGLSTLGKLVKKPFHSVVDPLMENKVTGGAIKGVLKGLDNADKYTLSPLRNMANTNLKDLKEAEKYVKDGNKLKSQSTKDLMKFMKNETKTATSDKRRDSMDEVFKSSGISTGSKYGDKALSLATEMVVDPLNLAGVGVGKAGLKGLSKLKKGKNLTKETQLLLDAPKPGAKFENVKELNIPTKTLVNRTPIKGKITTLKKPIQQKPFDYDGERQQLEFIRQADREDFVKRNQPLIESKKAELENEYRKQLEQEIEFEGHQQMAKEYKQIRDSVGKRLNIPIDNHSDFATQLSKHMYSAKGKGNGDDIYKVAEDMGFNNPDEFINYYNNAFESHKIVNAGKNKFITQQISGNPDNVVDDLYNQSESAMNLQKSFDDLELRKSQIPVGDDYINQLLSGNVKQSKATREEVLHADPQPLDPTTAPLSKAPKHYVIPKKIEGPSTSVNQAYTPQIGDGQRMNFEKGQVEDVPLSHVEQVKQRSNQLVNDLDSDNWSNKSSFGLNRETADRNADEIFGKDAQVMKDTYFEPIKQNEAERIKYLRGIKETTDKMYKSFKLSNKDDQLIQKFGEGKISIDELKKETKNWQNVEKAVNWYRTYYDDVINQLNDSLTRNGFDPIPKLENYFPHYNDEGNFLKDIFGIDKTNHELPTDINGLTENFRPQKNFFGNAMKRTGDKTSFGALQGLSQYIEGASNLIYHTDNIRNIRSLEEAIRKKYPGEGHLNNITKWLKEYGDQLAGKKGVLDRGPEGVFGRGVYNTAKTLQNNIGKAFTSYNVGSALTGFIPGIFAASQTGKVALTKALFETLQNTVKNDKFVDSSPFLTRRIGADPLHSTKFQKFSDKGYWLMKQIDNFNAQIIVRGKYNELSSKGLSHDEAIKKADDFAARVMADRSKGQMPLLFNQKTLGPITQFQLEINNQLSHIMKDMPKNALSKSTNKGKQALHIASAFGQMAIYGWAFNELYKKVTGRRPALDPIDYAMTFYKSLNGDAKATDIVKDVTGQVPFTSLFVGGRIPIDAAIPNVPDIMKQVSQSDGSWSEIGKVFGEEALEKTPYLAVPGYAQFKKTKDSAKALNEEVPGVYTDSGNLKYLVGDDLPNKLKGLTFGPGAFRETGEYYNNNRRMLGEKQTYNVVNSPNPKEAYNQEMIKRVDNNLKKLQKQPITKESDKKMQKLMEQLKKMRGE